MSNTEKRSVCVLFRTKHGNDGSVTEASSESELTKADLMNLVSDWWDCYGTHLEDYQELHMKFKDRINEGAYKNE